MHKETKATAINKKVKEIVFERDKGRCVVCGRPGIPNSHIIRRSRGGLGIPENIVTHCHECHAAYDRFSPYHVRKTRAYIQRKYPGFDDYDRVYHKYRRDKWTEKC